MPLETFEGPNVDDLLAQAQTLLGPDAVVIRVERSTDRSGFMLLAADPTSARAWSPPEATFPPRLTGFSPSPKTLGSGNAGPAVMALVGPTGVGKTTTLAKLATHPAVFGGLAVGFLSLDTFRIGAVEQLKIYADLAGLPCEVAYEEADLPRVLRRLSDREIILVDTVGRGPAGTRDRAATFDLLQALDPVEVHLVLPAGMQPALARRAIEAHRRPPVTHLLVSKLDEFPEERFLRERALSSGLPMRWVTNGQDVPFDLRSAQVWRLESHEPNELEVVES